MLRHANGDRPQHEARQAVRRLIANSNEQEQAAVLTTLRRGASWQEALDWLERTRREATSLEDGVYDRALTLYGDSSLLDWKECLDVAPALVYRPEGLPQPS